MQSRHPEFRSPSTREADIAALLPRVILAAQRGSLHALSDVDASLMTHPQALGALPLLRKADLVGGAHAALADFEQVFQSPGPIYEPGLRSHDWWRLASFLRASGVGVDDLVQNCFSYHFTPAGLMFDNAAAAVGARVFAAGTGQSEQQAQAAAALGVSTYAGTPDFLQVILRSADEQGLPLAITKAVVGGGALFPSLRAAYAERGISTRQCYATAEVGNIAYESEALEGLIVDDGVIVEIVTPGTADPVPDGEVGELVVTRLNLDYPLVRFATGDLSSILPGQSPCGRSNTRIRGWMGRADQTTKVKGLFVRPEQVARFVELAGLEKARLLVGREAEQDTLHVQIVSATPGDDTHIAKIFAQVFTLRAHRIEQVSALANDGCVIEDQRDFGE